MFSALNQGSTYYADRVENGVVQINYNYSGCGATNIGELDDNRPSPAPRFQTTA